MKTIIIQARLGSTRFPRKILEPIEGMPLLYWCIRNCWDADYWHRGSRPIKIIVATPKRNKEIKAICDAFHIPMYVHKGDENDVLARYYHCAKKFKADPIARVTSDCPFINHHVINAMFEFLGDYEFAGNTRPLQIFPSGFDVEVFTFKALETANLNAKSSYEREHVTPWMIRHCRVAPITAEKFKMSVDTPEDLKFARRIA